MNKRDYKRIELKEKEWDLAILEFKLRLCNLWKIVKHELKLDIKHMIDFMMYYSKPKDKFERTWHTFEWWGIILIIFFALKGIFG